MMTIAKKIVIFGAGGSAREVLWAIRDCNQDKYKWDILGFIDDNTELHGQTLCELPILGGFDWVQKNISHELCGICGIGNPHIRKLIHERYSAIGLDFATIIHPSAQMSRYVDIAPGVFIAAGNVITTQVILREHVFLNSACTVGHDAVLDQYVNCSPGCNISGNVHLSTGVHVGTGAKIIQNLTVGEWSVIGAGAVVIRNVLGGETVVGVPARIIRVTEEVHNVSG